MVIRYRYSMWDGTQEVPDVQADEILDNLTDDLMNFGDLQHALRNLLQRGMRNPMGDRTQGLRDLLQQLRQQRRQRLDKFNLNSIFDDLKQKLDEIVNMGTGVDRRWTRQRASSRTASPGTSSRASRGQPAGRPAATGRQPQRDQQQGGQQEMGRRRRGSRSAAAGQEGGEGQGQQGQQSQGSSRERFAEMLRNIANKKKDFLSQLPNDTSGQMRQLRTTSSWTRRLRPSSMNCSNP
jgi:hypothetical protein